MLAAVKGESLPILARIGAYEHPSLVRRIQEKLNLDAGAAQQLFVEMKRFLALCGMSGTSLTPSKMVDEAWHHFILFTKQYRAFCFDHFGRMIHHVPAEVGEDASLNFVAHDAYRATFGEHPSLYWTEDEHCSEGNACPVPRVLRFGCSGPGDYCKGCSHGQCDGTIQ